MESQRTPLGRRGSPPTPTRRPPRAPCASVCPFFRKWRKHHQRLCERSAVRPRRERLQPRHSADTAGAQQSCVCIYDSRAVGPSPRNKASLCGSHNTPLLYNPCSFVGFGLVFNLGRQRKVLWQIKFSSEILTVSVGIKKKKKTHHTKTLSWVTRATVLTAGLPVVTVACVGATRIQAQTIKSLTREARPPLQGSVWRRGHRGLTSGEGSEPRPQRDPLCTELVWGCPSPRTSPSSPRELDPCPPGSPGMCMPGSAWSPWEGPHRLILGERE